MPEHKPEMMQGKNRILLFRLLEDQSVEAAKLVFQTDHTFSYSRSLDRIVTKDGTIIKVGELEAEVSIEAVQALQDPTYAMLQEAAIKGKKLELWEVSVDEKLKNAEGKYPAVYAQGYLDSWEPGAPVEDEASISSNFIVELEPQFGFATLTDAQEKVVQYAFTDTTAVVNGGE
ncbi:phage major tail protein, TP901-1 family [Halalkalibacterium halodurans]|uniref:phage major tail protein, TP901-1 family n=1 Tax=Halalkalibacterium halodurans TaxID=86665 RepID=UPI002E1A53C6|nr:phage major tail protein, TP901-1 family [Halalkalibacterium halodurans]MED4083870.1 phage major tail protein, TP901-1 family [Halalkalibacterium halodurans]MED4105507.1 phage major tail protein, TP901-1 family [Halalkalibacterium halodurans]MED4109287.1 phage major tail protein, TP901-1 family [Halalkalibacterium halodurans]MED4149699.1 phage major tail protein, TP901-1 family [Halalkalibacterium halodurans]